MKTVAIIYYSRQGHTQFIAQQIQRGILSQENIEVDLLSAEHIIDRAESLIQYDGLIWGSPTYLGGVASKLKQLMDATGPLWKKQSFKGKLAAGFTVSSLLTGDKQSTLISLFTFCMQHGMLWVGNAFCPSSIKIFPMLKQLTVSAQVKHTSNPNRFDEGDIKAAQLFEGKFCIDLKCL